jgi:hypothetical protein
MPKHRYRLFISIGILFISLLALTVQHWVAGAVAMPFDVYDVEVGDAIPAVWRDDEHRLLQNLSHDLHAHPEASRFLVRRRVILSDGSLVAADAAYDRKAGRLEFRINNRSVTEWSDVSSRAVHQVSSRSGRWADLSAYGCRRRPDEH